MKTCTRCHEVKPAEDFSKRKQLKDGLRSQCKACDRQFRDKDKQLQYIKALPEEKKQLRNTRRRELYKQKKQIGLIKAPDKAAYNNWRRHRYASNPQYRIAYQIRNRLKKTLDKKLGDVDQLIGCSLEQLKSHLESQFSVGMTWENHGQFGWHIDHIVPLSSFDLTDEEQLKKACNYTNLQPLWWRDNIKKSNKLLV